MSHRIEERNGTVRAVWNGATIATSDHTLFVERNHYFPPDAIDRAYFKPSGEHTHCPWKGDASYYDIVVEGQSNPAAAWYYPEPFEEAAPVRDHVAFWRGVEVIEG